jgi:hypothetical protein
MRTTQSSSKARTSANAPGKAVSIYHGPRPGASRQLARSTAARITAGMAKAAPVKLTLDGRAFHLEDYRRASQLIQSYRAGKNGDQDQWVDALAVAMAAVFEADSRQFGVPFSPAYFVAGTR